MGYEIAVNKAWGDLSKLAQEKTFSLKFLADEYTLDLGAEKVFSLACNVPAKDFSAILILHYLAHKLKGLRPLIGEWLDFRQLSGVEGYLDAFRKRAIEPILRKYGNNPQGMLAVLERFPAKRINQGDVGIVIEAFEGVPVMITLWRGDDEFPPDANMFFDRSITDIFCTEDIVVLAGFVAGAL